MSIITEQRWKCDYCGVVSPVIGEAAPHGWLSIAFSLEVRAYGGKILRGVEFCCDFHKMLWIEKQSHMEGATIQLD